MDSVEDMPTKTYNTKNTIKSKKDLARVQNKYDNELCNNDMTFEDCELTILRQAVDVTEKVSKRKLVNNDDITSILSILEDFLKKKKLVCYGGTAINNILPKEAQFYDRELEIPDYDFYSPNALKHAIELSNIYYKNGYTDVEAKSGVHKGTFKVFVNFIPIADITQLHNDIFDTISKDAITIQGIKYSPPNFLRMNMYLELSRPRGDVSRWEKVLKRLVLLNKYYPMKPGVSCKTIEFQRQMPSLRKDKSEPIENIFNILWESLVKQEVVFFGGYAASLFSKYMIGELSITKKVPDFDIIAENPEVTSTIIAEALKTYNIDDVEIIKHAEIDEIIPEHIEFKVRGTSVLFIYKPIACHSYNKINIHGKKVRIATIDTILTFYLAFIYTNTKHYSRDRLLCMAKYLFDVEARNRLSNKGLLKRFSISCFGKQKTIEEIRQEKAEQYKKLRNKKNTTEYNEWFLKYNPSDVFKTGKTLRKTTMKSKINIKSKSKPKTKTRKTSTSTDNDWLY
jgi:hypothetical protein